MGTILAAKHLDRRIRQEYPVIDSIDRFPSSRTLYAPTVKPMSEADSMINNLKQDYYGIMFNVLLKEGFVRDLDDFVDWVG